MITAKRLQIYLFLLQTAAARHKDQENFQFQLHREKIGRCNHIDAGCGRPGFRSGCFQEGMKGSPLDSYNNFDARVNQFESSVIISRRRLLTREHKRDQAVRAHDSLVTRLANLVSNVGSTSPTRYPAHSTGLSFSKHKRQREISTLSKTSFKRARQYMNLPNPLSS